MASQSTHRGQKEDPKVEGGNLVGGMGDGNGDLSMRDEVADILAVERGERGNGRESWISRFNQVIVNGYTMQLGSFVHLTSD